MEQKDSVTIQCPCLTCKAYLRVPVRVRGKNVRCPKCNSSFKVPPGKTSNVPVASSNTAKK